ncbi:MAG: hypothetical protein L3K25_00130 [Gammaproteobacteria bacterium]|nr:hypothetical protein [Gammaproteobacteria bacterium]
MKFKPQKYNFRINFPQPINPLLNKTTIKTSKNMTNKLIHTYTPGILVIALFLLSPTLFADQPNDDKEYFFKVINENIPKTKNIIYISESYNSSLTSKEKKIFTIKAMTENGNDGIPIIEGKSIFSIQASPGKSELLLISPDHSPNKNHNTDWLNSHIWLYKKGKFKQLTSGKVMDSDPVWSLSGNKIYFTRSKIFSDPITNMLTATESDIWVMNTNGSKPLQLTFAKKNVVNSAPGTIKDSKKILFTTNRNEKWQMFTMDEDGSNQAFFIDNGILGKWSPDGRFLAYMDASPGNIYLANQDGELVRRLTEEGDVNFSPTWSPDSQYLTYSRINATHLRNHNLSEDKHYPGDAHKHEYLPEDIPDFKNIPKSFLREEPYADIWKLSINKKEGPKRLTNEGLNNNFPHWVTISNE